MRIVRPQSVRLRRRSLFAAIKTLPQHLNLTEISFGLNFFTLGPGNQRRRGGKRVFVVASAW